MTRENHVKNKVITIYVFKSPFLCHIYNIVISAGFILIISIMSTFYSSPTFKFKDNFSFQRYHYGLVTVSDGKCRPQTTRLKLSTDMLVLQREEFIFPDDDDGYPVDNKVSLLLNTFFSKFSTCKSRITKLS